MDLYETINKCPSYDSKKKFGSLSGLESDSSHLSRKEKESMKSMKYYTQNFFDKTVIQNRGIFFHDGFGIPSCEIDNSTANRFGDVTNLNLVQSLPTLPLRTTASLAKGQGPVEIEDKIRPVHDRNLKQCNPKDTDFYKRSFSIFDYLPVRPNECVDNVVQQNASYRQGINTRHSLNTNYRNGCTKK